MQVGRGCSGAVPIVCLAVLFAGFTSCRSSSNDLALAEEGVVRFHSQFDAEQFHTIYSESDEQFRQAGSESDMITFFQAVRRKLGRLEEPRRLNAEVKWIAGKGTFVMVSYQTKFSDGNGTESFTWRVGDGRALLVGYNINSNDLILK